MYISGPDPLYYSFVSQSAIRLFLLEGKLRILYSNKIADYILQDFKIQNIVGSCDVKFPIRLEGLAYSHSAFSSVSDLKHCDHIYL